jgi:hypothetical protein
MQSNVFRPHLKHGEPFERPGFTIRLLGMDMDGATVEVEEHERRVRRPKRRRADGVDSLNPPEETEQT